MFTSDFAEDFSGLSLSQIKSLEDKGILEPVKKGRSKYYGYGDIYILRIFKILKRQGVQHANIRNAYEYLRTLNPEQSLSSFLLLHDRKHVYTVIDGNHLNASKFGQMILNGTIKMIAVGSELEQMRCQMNEYVETLHKKADQPVRLKKFASSDLAKLLAWKVPLLYV